MNCPACNTVALQMTERSGIEIDYCPQCRGVWLDRGELDKIIERANREAAPVAPTGRDERRYEERRTDDRDYRRYDDDDYKYKKRKKSFFEELFD